MHNLIPCKKYIPIQTRVCPDMVEYQSANPLLSIPHPRMHVMQPLPFPKDAFASCKGTLTPQKTVKSNNEKRKRRIQGAKRWKRRMEHPSLTKR